MALNTLWRSTWSTWSACREAPRRLLQRELPLALLLLALATLFFSVIDRGYFYQFGHHNWNSSKVLAHAENITPQWGLTLFHFLEPDQDGNSVPHGAYNRFPIGAYVLIRLVALPFGDDLSAKILAGRVLMLACFVAAAALAYLALARITESRWVACAATALAFSSYFCLYYSDMISTEASVDLFAVLLAFHGMTVFVQEGRFRQLLAKTCIALALGWHVYALLLPFIAFSLASDLISTHRAPAPALGSRLKRSSAVLFLGRPFALAATALAIGVLVLSSNLLGEYYMLKGTRPVAELPTWESMMRRIGLADSYEDLHARRVHWPAFLAWQFQALGRMILPYALPGYVSLPIGHYPDWEAWMPDLFAVGVAALAICLVWLCFHPQRTLLATLTLSGFAWSLPMRHNAALHDHESVFYVGVPLTLFSLVLLHLHKLSGERVVARIAAVALLVFVFSNWQLNRARQNAAERAIHMEELADFQAVREQTEDGAVGVVLMGKQRRILGAPLALEYYLARRPYLVFHYPVTSKVDLERFQVVDYVVTNWRAPGIDTLTTENRGFFLYPRDAYLASQHDATRREILASGRFDIYKEGNILIYRRSPCKLRDREREIGLHVFPVNRRDLPRHRRQYGFEDLSFRLTDHGGRRAKTCTAWIRLPTYDIAEVRTGQTDAGGPAWRVEVPLAP